MVKCDLCKKDGIIHLSYGPHTYCKLHFIKQFEKRVKKTITKYNLINNKDKKIGVGVSGGKDSLALVFLLNKILKKTKTEIIAIFINENIKDYSDINKKIVIEFCKKNNIKLLTKDYKEYFDIEIKKIKNKNKSTCSYCSVLKRRLMDVICKENNIKKIATGHNLDDEAQTFLMNIFDNDILRIYKSGPNTGIYDIKEFTKKIKPFYFNYEREIGAYCLYNNIKYNNNTCPYYNESKRTYYHKFINDLENKIPGSKYKLINSYLNIKNNYKYKKEKINKCIICNQPTSSKICNVCKTIKEIKNA